LICSVPGADNENSTLIELKRREKQLSTQLKHLLQQALPADVQILTKYPSHELVQSARIQNATKTISSAAIEQLRRNIEETKVKRRKSVSGVAKSLARRKEKMQKKKTKKIKQKA
jgi:Holliday junction resolvasome RuvABC endonuclease subunit